ncbi:hypothetical protein GCM10012275_15840 [Longimycelium tulufanense]|uniref:Uncharacterized protein n=1 Tax=Longimycelium tulufanense TaxID=907463 RepID=A0A8J3CDU1_9PSEU|nr:hypothetical protein [Longimycelium tulufanense]GGM45616.1 hypothetical protein GCM10012275_15840 [Longimycelium tulufanense]
MTETSLYPTLLAVLGERVVPVVTGLATTEQVERRLAVLHATT